MNKQRIMALVRKRQAEKTARRSEIERIQNELADWRDTRFMTVFTPFEKPSQELLDNYDIIISSLENKLSRLGV